MKRLTLIDSAPIPGTDGELKLFADGDHFSIKIAGGGDLMSTRMHGSEDALAHVALARIAGVANPRILIGGLGMGFTLAAALGRLGPQAQVVVAELVPGVVRWNRGPLGGHAGFPLDDPRAEVRETDVLALIRSQAAAWDAILLDVDNGPGGLTQSDNDRIYALSGLLAARAALRPDGVLAVWSAHADRQFSERLHRAGFAVEEVPVRAHGNKGARHLIWLATRQARATPGKPARRTRIPRR